MGHTCGLPTHHFFKKITFSFPNFAKRSKDCRCIIRTRISLEWSRWKRGLVTRTTHVVHKGLPAYLPLPSPSTEAKQNNPPRPGLIRIARTCVTCNSSHLVHLRASPICASAWKIITLMLSYLYITMQRGVVCIRLTLGVVRLANLSLRTNGVRTIPSSTLKMFGIASEKSVRRTTWPE